MTPMFSVMATCPPMPGSTTLVLPWAEVLVSESRVAELMSSTRTPGVSVTMPQLTASVTDSATACVSAKFFTSVAVGSPADTRAPSRTRKASSVWFRRMAS